MGELTNALQGKLNSRKGLVKDPAEKQLDLFSSLSDRAPSVPKIVMSKPEAQTAPAPEPEMVLPPSTAIPPDVAADVRAVLSESGPARPVENAEEGNRPALRTGVYHRPQRPAPPPRPVAPPPATEPRLAWTTRMRGWLAGVELDRRMISLIVVLIVLAALAGFWSACPRGQEEPAAGAEAPAENPAPAEAAPVAPTPAAVAAPAPAAPAPAPKPAALAPADWKIPGTETFLSGGAYLIRFSDPVFVSADKISIEGMRALKAVGAKLAALKAGARVVVTGYTDDVPLSKPTPEFRNNADIAAARAKVAVEHLSQFARANAALTFEAQAGESVQAPFPNDTPQNRRLNRTVTVQVVPAP
ncbi:MAG TPA: hypothetical protein PK388_06115 [Kiritimatiellia bacterium]|nr:hypothetical protein [Kiritimatiellia bacterium]